MKIIDDFKLAHARIQTYMQGFFTIHKGRMHRLDYLVCFMLADFLYSRVVILFENIDMTKISAIVFITIAVVHLYFVCCIFSKRLRDVGLSGLWIIPFVIIDVCISFIEMPRGWIESGLIEYTYITAAGYIAVFIFLLLWPPQKTDNEYGAFDPISYTNHDSILKRERQSASAAANESE